MGWKSLSFTSPIYKSKYSPLNILSFGSSDGSEVKDLITTFPNSIIHGLEINKDLVAKCNSNNMNKI